MRIVIDDKKVLTTFDRPKKFGIIKKSGGNVYLCLKCVKDPHTQEKIKNDNIFMLAGYNATTHHAHNHSNFEHDMFPVNMHVLSKVQDANMPMAGTIVNCLVLPPSTKTSHGLVLKFQTGVNVWLNTKLFGILFAYDRVINKLKNILCNVKIAGDDNVGTTNVQPSKSNVMQGIISSLRMNKSAKNGSKLKNGEYKLVCFDFDYTSEYLSQVLSVIPAYKDKIIFDSIKLKVLVYIMSDISNGVSVEIKSLNVDDGCNDSYISSTLFESIYKALSSNLAIQKMTLINTRLVNAGLEKSNVHVAQLHSVQDIYGMPILSISDTVPLKSVSDDSTKVEVDTKETNEVKDNNDTAKGLDDKVYITSSSSNTTFALPSLGLLNSILNYDMH